MNAPPESKSENARRFYDLTALAADDFYFMNYGYAAGDAVLSEGGEGFCLHLYRHLIYGADLGGKRVLEVSCGRGGGAASIATEYRPSELVGVDFSENNLRLARSRFATVPGLRFLAGRAERLPFGPGSVDAVINVEASHLYDDVDGFLAEVRRVLRPAGQFFYADLCWANVDAAQLICNAGFSIASQEDITDGVVRALELDSDRREGIVRNNIPEGMQQDYRNWSGVKGYRAYNRFVSREWVYRVIRARPS
jgi:SAM-dependent methyltransferase